MSTFAPRTGATLFAGTELVDESGVNANTLLFDSGIACQWVTDGSDPSMKFDGAHFKEITSQKEYILRTDGAGGWLKKPVVGIDNLGTINHYNKVVSGTINSLSPSNSWQSTAGTAPSAWTVDRAAPALIRVLIEVTPGAVTALYYRLSGITASQSVAYFVTGGVKVGIYFTYWMNLSPGSFQPSLDVYNVVSANSVISTISYYVDTNAVLT